MRLGTDKTLNDVPTTVVRNPNWLLVVGAGVNVQNPTVEFWGVVQDGFLVGGGTNEVLHHILNKQKYNIK
jgi:hypothetical protein